MLVWSLRVHSVSTVDLLPTKKLGHSNLVDIAEGQRQTASPNHSALLRKVLTCSSPDRTPCSRKTRKPRAAISLCKTGRTGESLRVVFRSKPMTSAPSTGNGAMRTPCLARREIDSCFRSGTPVVALHELV
eukprot:1064164-Rhodomonas_salina.1